MTESPWLLERRLIDICLPYSHDAGTYGVSLDMAPYPVLYDKRQGYWKVLKALDHGAFIIGAKAQHDQLYAQLRNGTRLFDLRLCFTGSSKGPAILYDFQIHHTLLGPYADDVFRYMDEVKNDHELVVLFITHMDDLDASYAPHANT